MEKIKSDHSIGQGFIEKWYKNGMMKSEVEIRLNVIVEDVKYRNHLVSMKVLSALILYTCDLMDQHNSKMILTLQDLSILLTKLVDLDGRIMIDGFYDSVLPLSDEEKQLYENIEFSLEDYKNYLGVDRVISEDANTVRSRDQNS